MQKNSSGAGELEQIQGLNFAPHRLPNVASKHVFMSFLVTVLGGVSPDLFMAL